MLNLKIKQLLFLLLIFNIQIIVAQSGETGESTVPNQIPPTPETFQFTKYGDIPVNESSGDANVDIPLYTYKAGSIEVPISIAHGGGAVRVDEANTWTGINWQLNVGGVVSRTVNDLPDENASSSTRKRYTSLQLGSLSVNQIKELAAEGIDSEVDIFNFNFPGYSGSFYLDTALLPVLTKYDKELKIELSANPTVNGILQTNMRTITITTPDGTRYSFGGTNASESTKSRSGQADHTVYAQTGFYLFQIENFKGDKVTFNYLSSGPSSETVGYSQSITKDVYVESMAECAPTPGVHFNQKRPYYLESMGKMRVRSITSNRDPVAVEFNATLQSPDTNLHKFVLNNITVFSKYISENNAGNKIHKKIVFEYISPVIINSIYQRFFLDKIKIFEGTNTTTDNIHSFEYNSPELLPDRFSYSQDYAGYYNGKNNTTFVPKVNDPFFNLGPTVHFADRSVVLETTVYGSLKKVIYPTKGFTEFEYESVIDETINEFESMTKYLNIYHNDPARELEDDHHAVANVFPELDDTGSPQSLLNPSVPITVNITATVTGSLSQHHFIRFTLDDRDSTNDIVETIQLVNGHNTEKNYTVNRVFTNLNPLANYEFRLDYDITTADGLPQYMIATASVTFGSHTSVNNYKPGIRIKRVKSYTADSTLPLTTRYYYNLAGIKHKNNSEFIVRPPHFTSESITSGSCESLGSDGYMHCYSYTVFSKSIHGDTQNNLYINDNNRSLYQYVTVSYGGDNFENGGKESRFFIQGDAPLSPLSANSEYVSLRKASNNSLKNGSVLKETYFSANATFNVISGSILTGKIKEVTNTYISLEDKNNKVTSCFATKIHAFPECIIMSNSYVGNIFYGYYETFSWWHTLEKTETKEYFANGTINNRTEYFYDSKLAGLPSRIINTVNDLNPKIQETKYYYPIDLSAEPYMSPLIASHRIIPIKTVQSKNGIILSEEKTVYGNNINTGNIALPKNVFSAKFPNANPIITNIGQLERKITYDKYDTNGTIQQYTIENGPRVSFIWGYNKTQVVAKIENGTYANIPAATIASIQAKSDTDTEANLIQALNDLRVSLPNAMVTTYTHKPLVGISTVTDPKGDKITYEYDDNNRLKTVKDAQNNILSENQYNYRPN